MNWRIVLMGTVIAIGAMTVFPGSRVPEVHNAHQPFNFALVDPRPSAEDWPSWRGKDGRNVALSDDFPMKWSGTEHEGWQVTLPGYGNASPILWGHQLFLPFYESESRRLLLHCLHRKTGRILWKTVLHQGGFPQAVEKKSMVSSTPACDGQNVFTVTNVQGKLWVTAVDLNGQIVWQREAGPYQSTQNYSSSPVFFKSLVIVAADQASDSYLTALHRQTGEMIWRIHRGRGESAGSPIVATIAGRAQLILGGPGAVTSYDPGTGKRLWVCQTSTERVANSVAFDDDRVFATRGVPNSEVLCIRANGSGDVTRTHVEWRLSQIGAEMISPVCHGPFVYVLSDDGRLSCIQTTTGKIEWTKSLKGRFSASPVVVRDYLLCANEAGVSYFVSLGAAAPTVIENSLGDGIVASPVIVGDSIFIRTLDRLHRIVDPNAEPFVENSTSTKRRL